MDFIIDTAGDDELIDKDEIIGEENENDFEKGDEAKLASILEKIKLAYQQIKSEEHKALENIRKSKENKDDEYIDKFFTNMGWSQDPKFEKPDKKKKKKKNAEKDPEELIMFTNINLETGKFDLDASQTNVDAVMKKAVLTPGLEKEHSLPEYNVGKKRQKALKKAEKDKTTGPQWFNIPAPEITPELRNDLQILKMRSALDPKHFYKKNDMEILPKYFQVGTVVDSPLDHQNQKLTRKERKRTMVDELLADAEFKRYNKRKYSEIVEEKRRSTYKTYIKDKRMKIKMMAKQRRAEGGQAKKKRKN